MTDELLAKPEKKLIETLKHFTFDEIFKIYNDEKAFKSLYNYINHYRLFKEQKYTFFNLMYFENKKIKHVKSKIKFLVKKKLIDLNFVSKKGFPLFFAYPFNLDKKYNIDINKRDCYNGTFFHFDYGVNLTIKNLKKALEMGFDINSIDDSGNTIFHNKQKDSVDLLRFAIKNGFDPTVKNKLEDTCLEKRWCEKKPFAFLKVSVEYGSKPSLFNFNIPKITKRILKYAVENGLNIFERSDGKETIFHFRNFDIPALEYAIEQGFDINCKNKQNYTIFHRGSKNDDFDLDIIKYALGKGLDINTVNYYNSELILRNPKNLQFAIDNGLKMENWTLLCGKTISLDTIKTLLFNGYNINSKPYGMSFLAWHRIYPDALIYAMENGFNINELVYGKIPFLIYHLQKCNISQEFITSVFPEAIKNGLNKYLYKEYLKKYQFYPEIKEYINQVE